LTASPTSLHFGNQVSDGHIEGSHVQEKSVLGTEIYVYSGRLGRVSMLHVSAHLVDLVRGYYCTVSLAHTHFGDSYFKPRSPMLR
jgi:hypothetical protein